MKKQRFTLPFSILLWLILVGVLLLPLTGIFALRVYENELVRQTENELIAQGSVLAAFYKLMLAQENVPPDYGVPVTANIPPLQNPPLHPIAAQLNLRAQKIAPPRPQGMEDGAPDPAAMRVNKKIAPMIADIGMTTLAGIRILDAHGVVTGGNSEIGLSFAQIDEVKRALSGLNSSAIRQRISKSPPPALDSISRAGKTRVFVALPILFNDHVAGVVYLSRSPRNVWRALYEERDSLALIAIVVVVFITLLAWIMGELLARPLRQLSQQAAELTRGHKPETPLPKVIVTELASLQSSYETMAATIAERSAYIHNFAMHVAHEFKTPLTGIQGAIELLSDHRDDMSPEDYSRFIANAVQDTQRLNQLVTRLLELARADILQTNTMETNVLPLLRQLVQNYQSKDCSIHIDNGKVPEDIKVFIESDILETILVNLLQNSQQHNAANIIIVLAQDNEFLRISVSDDGTGISDGNKDKIFTPFFTTRREAGGTGLGLTISKTLLKAYGGDVQSVPQSQGAQFMIVLKNGNQT